uniref:PH domain-containing protein n=1 Tax=Ditylenchus dipsaci TaxID=166011 RepID=A0A915CL05_9BILA
MSSLTIQNYFAATLKKTNKRQDVWLDAVETVINRSGKQYRRLKYVRLLGLFMVIYQRSDLPITQIQKSTVNTGFLDVLATKQCWHKLANWR